MEGGLPQQKKAGKGRQTFPKKIPHLSASEDTPWNRRRNKILQRNRTRRHREKKKRESEDSQSQSLIPSCQMSDTTEAEASLQSEDSFNSMDIFAESFVPNSALEESASQLFDGNAQVYDWDDYPSASGVTFEQNSQPILPPDSQNSRESVGNDNVFPLTPSGIGEDTDTGSSAAESDSEETVGNEGEFLSNNQPTLLQEMNAFAKDVAALKATSNISDNAMEKAFKLFHKHSGAYTRLTTAGIISPSYRNSVRPLLVRQAPPVKCAIKVLRVFNGKATAEMRTGLTGIRKEFEYLPANERVLYTVASTTVREVKQHFLSRHLEAGIPREILDRQLRLLALSSDAVEESNKGKRKFHAVTIRFGSDIYILKIFHPLTGDDEAKLSAEELIGDVIDEIREDPELKLRWYIADTPERHVIKGLIAATGYHSCEMCLAPGEWFNGIWWPCALTSKQSERTNAFMRETARNLDHLSKDARKGVVGTSPLSRLHYFDLTWDAPTEEFHLVKEGYFKGSITGLLYTSKAREVVVLAEEYSYIYSNMRVLSEMSRRTRSIRIAKMKGNELGVMMMSTIPSLVEILPKEGHWAEAAKSLLVFFFLVRLYYQDDPLYKKAKHELLRRGITLEGLHDYLYNKHEESFNHFGGQRSTINIHHFHHLWKSRERNGPLWMTSGESFESVFGALKRLHRAGTRNSPKQILENHWMHETFSHDCRYHRKMRLAPRKADMCKVDDSLLYNHAGEVFSLQEVTERDGETAYRCHRVDTEEFKPWQLRFLLPWKLIGVKKYMGIEQENEVFLSGKDIKGKAVLCEDILTFWQNEWLMSTSS